MSLEGGGDRVTSTLEETAGVDQFDSGFEWAPKGRPCHPLAYLIEALPYAVYSIFLVLVIVAGIWGAAMFAGPTMDVASGAVDGVELNPFGGGDDSEAEADPVASTPTETATPTDAPTETEVENPTETATPMASATPSPTPSPTATVDPTPTLVPTPTPTNGGGFSGTPTDTITATATTAATPIPTATPSSTPEPTPEPEANFAVTIASTNSPVGEGDPLQVDATIENTADGDGEQTITLAVGGSQRDSTTIRLASGESTQETVTWSTSDGDAGDYTAEVASEDDAASTSVSVEEKPAITQFDASAECAFEFTDPDDADLSVTWDTTNADSVEVEILDENGTEVAAYTGTSGSESASDEDGCGETYTFKILATNSVGEASDSTPETA